MERLRQCIFCGKELDWSNVYLIGNPVEFDCCMSCLKQRVIDILPLSIAVDYEVTQHGEIKIIVRDSRG
jgi:hypothetical protein